MRKDATSDFRAYLHLVEPVARKIAAELPDGFGSDRLDDLIGAGLLGLVKALSSYDPGKSVPFSYWAKCRIRGEILDSVKREAYRYALNRRTLETVSDQPAADSALRGDLKLGKALESLTPQERQVLELLYVEGRSAREIERERVLDIGRARVRQIHQRALAKLRRTIRKAA